MNPRDERGWRIPREGTKSWEIYHLMVAGFKDREIIELYQEDHNQSSIRVLATHIRLPEKQNALSNKWWRNNPEKIHARSKIKYSKYVAKLVKILGISYTEAVALERKELEKVK